MERERVGRRGWGSDGGLRGWQRDGGLEGGGWGRDELT